MRYLSISEILELHERLIASSGGATGIRDLAALESAVSQPHGSFGDEDLYPDLVTKAAALCFSIVMNHPFVDGNKRVGHAAMETFLLLNGYEICAKVDVLYWTFRRVLNFLKQRIPCRRKEFPKSTVCILPVL